MVIFKKNLKENLIQVLTKTHQIAPIKKNSSGGHTPKPPWPEHGASQHTNFKI